MGTRRKRLIIVVGKTSCGKDTVCNHMKEKYGIGQICSYTTRKMRDYEEDGVQHYFVSEEKMDELEKRSDILAWTKFPKTGIRYCATLGSMGDTEAMSYIVDPNGVDYLLDHSENLNADLIILYLHASENVIRKRAALRGDDPKNIDARIASESEQFDNFMRNKRYDYLINTEVPKKQVLHKIDEILEDNGFVALC